VYQLTNSCSCSPNPKGPKKSAPWLTNPKGFSNSRPSERSQDSAATEEAEYEPTERDEDDEEVEKVEKSEDELYDSTPRPDRGLRKITANTTQMVSERSATIPNGPMSDGQVKVVGKKPKVTAKQGAFTTLNATLRSSATPTQSVRSLPRPSSRTSSCSSIVPETEPDVEVGAGTAAFFTPSEPVPST
jgi:hypothetical protein